MSELVINSFEDAIKSTTKFIFNWIITLCRVVVGSVVFKTGLDYTRGNGTFAHQELDDGITGIFVMVIGAYFVFSSLNRGLFGYEKNKQK